jgi:hypothetical protein
VISTLRVKEIYQQTDCVFVNLCAILLRIQTTKAFLFMINTQALEDLLLEISELLAPYCKNPNPSQKALIYLLELCELVIDHDLERGYLERYVEHISSRLYILGCCSVGLTDLLEKKILKLSFELDKIRFF